MEQSSLGCSLMAQMVKNLPVMQETWVQSLGQEDPLEEVMATHSSILAWRIPWTEEPGGLQSMRLSSRTAYPFFKIYLFMATLGLGCCAQSFPSCGRWGTLSSSSVSASPCCGFSLQHKGFSSFSTWT